MDDFNEHRSTHLIDTTMKALILVVIVVLAALFGFTLSYAIGLQHADEPVLATDLMAFSALVLVAVIVNAFALYLAVKASASPEPEPSTSLWSSESQPLGFSSNTESYVSTSFQG